MHVVVCFHHTAHGWCVMFKASDLIVAALASHLYIAFLWQTLFECSEKLMHNIGPYLLTPPPQWGPPTIYCEASFLYVIPCLNRSCLSPTLQWWPTFHILWGIITVCYSCTLWGSHLSQPSHNISGLPFLSGTSSHILWGLQRSLLLFDPRLYLTDLNIFLFIRGVPSSTNHLVLLLFDPRPYLTDLKNIFLFIRGSHLPLIMSFRCLVWGPISQISILSSCFTGCLIFLPT